MAATSEEQSAIKSEGQEVKVENEQMNEEERVENEDEVWEACFFPGKRRRRSWRAREQPRRIPTKSRIHRSLAACLLNPPSTYPPFFLLRSVPLGKD